jgi:outer membrane immunogenic protein
MKRLLLASATLLALTGVEAAWAGDMPPAVIYPAGAPPTIVYPVAAPPFTFTGFYVGGSVGGALGSSKYIETAGGTFTGLGPLVVSNINAAGTSSTAPRGVIGGGEAGYNWQIGHFVVGFETDLSGWGLSSNQGVAGIGISSTVNPVPPPPKVPGTGATFSSSTTVSSNWLFTARPRLGWANGNQLLYLTAGLAVTNVDFSQSILLGPVGTLAGSSSTTEVGWTAGGGVSYGLSWNWSIKAEYLYVNFPNQNTAQVLSGNPLFTGTGTVARNLTASIARAGFDYRF